MKKVKLCNDCRDTNGLLYDETVDPPVVTRCPCRDQRQTAARARDEAIRGVALSKPQQMREAYRIIAGEAEVSQWVNANTVRSAMETAQIDGPVRAAAFRKAVAEGIIEPDGEVVSSDVRTHAKRVAQYRSRMFARNWQAS